MIFFTGKKTIVNNVQRSGPFVVPGDRHARVFGSLYFWRFIFQDCCYHSFVDKIVGWIFRQIFKFVKIPDSTALRELLKLSILWKRREREREKDSFGKFLKVWNSEVSGILESSVKYDKYKHGINFKTLAIRNYSLREFRNFGNFEF